VSGLRARFARSIDLDVGGTAWRALPERAALWLQPRWLVVADAHVGKAATFRARGVPVPEGTTQANLARLTALIEEDPGCSTIFYRQLSRALGNRLLQIYDTVAECGGGPAGSPQ